MTSLAALRTAFWHWIDSVAATIVGVIERFTSSRLVRIVEQPDGTFTLDDTKVTIAGGHMEPLSPKLSAMLRKSRVELVLQPARFVFRPLELPQRASEFLAGIVRSQIDRLTPWSAVEAAYGWSAPKALGSDRMIVTLVATARALIAPLAAAVANLGVQAVIVTTSLQDAEAGAASVKVWDHRIRGELDARRLRRGLAALLLLMGIGAAGAVGAAAFLGDDLETRRFEIARRIAERRASAQLGRDGLGTTGVAALERRKREVPSSVIVLEALSQILPDHTYLTELRILGDRLQIVGITRDAPSLIRLIEQSSHFTRAVFFAPTTRSPGEAGEHFNIEARIEPVYTPGI